MNNYQILATELQQTEAKRIEAIAGNLMQLMDIVKNSIVINTERGEPRIESVLSDDELYALAIRIPTECIYIQEQANKLALSNTLSSILTDSDISENVQLLYGSKGDARERQKRAEAMCGDKLLRDAAVRQSIKILNDYIDRADKVYEGIKKIIDARSREFILNGKPGYPIGQ